VQIFFHLTGVLFPDMREQMSAIMWHLEKDIPVRFMHGSMCIRQPAKKPVQNKHLRIKDAGRTNLHPDMLPDPQGSGSLPG
jgi:hypothetical protein